MALVSNVAERCSGAENDSAETCAPDIARVPTQRCVTDEFSAIHPPAVTHRAPPREEPRSYLQVLTGADVDPV